MADNDALEEHADKKRKLEESFETHATPAPPLASPAALANLSDDDVKKMIKSFNYDMLVTIALSMVKKSPEAMGVLHEHWNSDVNNRKLYIRNLNLETTTETLHAAFATFGTIEEAAVIKDKSTNRSKGFGFVTFATADEAKRALASPTLNIEGRAASVALAAVGKAPTSESNMSSLLTAPSNDVATRKLFVRGLSYESTEASLQQFFSQYGNLAEVFLFRDKDTGKSKGHAFVVYLDAESAARALQDPMKTIDGRKAIAKLAIEGVEENQQRKVQQQLVSSANTLAAALAHQNAAMLPYGAAAAASPYSAYGGVSALHNIHSAMSAMQFAAPGGAAASSAAASQFAAQQHAAQQHAAYAAHYAASVTPSSPGVHHAAHHVGAAANVAAHSPFAAHASQSMQHSAATASAAAAAAAQHHHYQQQHQAAAAQATAMYNHYYGQAQSPPPR